MHCSITTPALDDSSCCIDFLTIFAVRSGKADKIRQGATREEKLDVVCVALEK